MNKHVVNLFVPTLIAIWTLAYLFDIRRVSAHNKLLILPASALIIVLYCYFAFAEYRAYKREAAAVHEKETPRASGWPKKEIAILLLLAVYLLVVPFLGFVGTSFLFMLSMLYLLGVRRAGLMIGFSAISTAVLYVAFKIVLMVPLPGGILGF